MEIISHVHKKKTKLKMRKMKKKERCMEIISHVL